MGAKEDQGIIQAMVEWFGLEGDEASKFVNDGMSRKGHKQVTGWTDAEGDKNDKSNSGFFGGGDKPKTPWSQYSQ